jgi:hypothetical protein
MKLCPKFKDKVFVRNGDSSNRFLVVKDAGLLDREAGDLLQFGHDLDVLSGNEGRFRQVIRLLKMVFLSPNNPGSWTSWVETEIWQMWLFVLCQESGTNQNWYRLLWHPILR